MRIRGVTIHTVKMQPEGEEWIRRKDLLKYFSWLKKQWKNYPDALALIIGMEREVNK